LIHRNSNGAGRHTVYFICKYTGVRLRITCLKGDDVAIRLPETIDVLVVDKDRSAHIGWVEINDKVGADFVDDLELSFTRLSRHLRECAAARGDLGVGLLLFLDRQNQQHACAQEAYCLAYSLTVNIAWAIG
jgi:hypothetical protein